MEDELLVGGPNNFSQPREFDLLQDDFLDLGGDDSQHAVDMHAALCLANPNTVANNVVMKEEPNFTTNTLDNPSAMKLDNLDSWDQDVLLSNAGLPETNPLLLDEDLDQSVGEDFQKMLNDWENHIGSLQSSDMPDVDMSTLVSSEVTASNSSSSLSSADKVIKTEQIESEASVSSPQIKQQLATVRDEQAGGQAKMTLGQMALAGIVISSGPGDYFETYEVANNTTRPRSLLRASRPTIVPLRDEMERKKDQTAVLEATDADNLLEQFEEASSDFDDNDQSNNPRKTSNIFKAVQNHFASSDSNSAGCRRLPRIVPSQRIKDALPREIIDRIKASSQKSRTIAIIEPVHKTVSTESSVTKASPSSNKPSIISKSHVIQPQQHHTRFAEAATSLNKTKHLRLISATSNPQQVQISLDHDYCSSSAKIKRNRLNNVNISRPLIRLQPSSKPSSIVVSSPMTSKSIVRVNPDSCITMPIAVEVTSANSASNAATPLSSPARKDSGLESGEASDTSEQANSDLYSKVPEYLSGVSVENADSRSVANDEDVKAYDRLPAYVKGVPKRLNSTDSPLPPEVISQSNSQQTSQQRARRSSSSSASNSSDEIKTSSRMTTRSKTSRRRRQSSSSSSSSSSEQRNSRRKLRRSWRKPSDRSRSPIQSSRVRTPSKQQRQVEERRVVYVGRISENTSRADLRKRFEVFGPIEEISVHFRDRGDNYGFVTFMSKNDAFAAIEHGNDDTSQPKVDLCFGGRRAFCKEKYADLDSGYPESRRFSSAGPNNIPMSDDEEKTGRIDDVEDFDALLNKARAGIRK